jgi:hypothetical protein
MKTTRRRVDQDPAQQQYSTGRAIRKMLLSMYPWRRRRIMMASLQDIYKFDQRLKELL